MIEISDSESHMSLQNNSALVDTFSNATGGDSTASHIITVISTTGFLLNVRDPSVHDSKTYTHSVAAVSGGRFAVEANTVAIKNLFASVTAASGAEWCLSPEIEFFLSSDGSAVSLSTASVESRHRLGVAMFTACVGGTPQTAPPPQWPR